MRTMKSGTDISSKEEADACKVSASFFLENIDAKVTGKKTKQRTPNGMRHFVNRQRPTFPGSFPPSIISAKELNFCVRDGNRWSLPAIVTGFLACLSRLLLCQRFGLPQSRTSVRSFLTPCAFVHKPRNPAQLSRYLVPSKLNNALCVIPETIGQAFDLLVSVS